MTETLVNLLALDHMSRRYGCGLNPALRTAVERDLLFPAKAASPPSSPLPPNAPLPERVVRLPQNESPRHRRKEQ
ncbi:hypothetical protein [uncultured Roseobacter sp.]|uniref:hypothetical protein n=1 Tax=uncultured Roseobacter sp. TaxID=114847 RepID=UPI002608F2BE|nr:hypothetical protein [uncultured Roseobacter sp.]